MARFDVYAYRSGDGVLLDVQANLLEHLNTRLVVPLLPLANAPRPAKRLNPVFTINATQYVMVTQFMAAVPVAEFGEHIDTLDHHFEAITNAIDMALQGF